MEKGLGVVESEPEAARWFEAAARQGHIKAQCTLGKMYEDGRGVPRDYTMAVQWFRESAEQGYDLAQDSLGYMYTQGLGVPQDYAEAANWFHKAAEQGLVRAQYNLGVMYLKGQGVVEDEIRAFFRRSLGGRLRVRSGIHGDREQLAPPVQIHGAPLFVPNFQHRRASAGVMTR